ncbi:MAG: ArsO family NAD(P)H-dependent flavin-containing monooxygenase [Chloroflexota bacterium]|nr:ArsO family NAD(P)H-dependent flavin-containing monooxygenase [Chloroflexota bacterium]
MPGVGENNEVDVLVIGGGQAGLALGYYLRRSGLRHVILDAQAEPGGAWLHTWQPLSLFSPARWSSLPGWIMPGGVADYPGRDTLLRYMAEYERRYGIPVVQPVRVEAVRHAGTLADGRAGFVVDSDRGEWRARAVVSATGNWERPYIPHYPGREIFRGVETHSANYWSPEIYSGKRVLVVGGGNSGAQIYAELSKVADATWVTRRPPLFMPDHIDGRYLFDVASRQYLAQQGEETNKETGAVSLGDIVMVAPVKEARDRGVLHTVRPFSRFTATGVMWGDGREELVDTVIWCTGFRAALDHLEPLGVVEPDGRVVIEGTRAVKEPMLWLLGYGDWTGYASATLVGVGRTARETVAQLVDNLHLHQDNMALQGRMGHVGPAS